MRVWITGLGAVTAAGPDAASLGRAMREGRAAVRPLPGTGTDGGRVDAFRRGREARHLDRSGAMMLAAAEEAWEAAGAPAADPARCTVVEGSSLGPMSDLLTAYAARRGRRSGGVGRPLDLVRYMPGAGGLAFARRHGLRGPVLHLSAGSASAGCAIAFAADRVATGAADVAVAGGAECPLQDDILASFATAGVTGAPCRPFDARRRGTVLGEGAGALVLESEAAARRRGVRPLAILSGWGTAGEDASRTRPDPRGTAVREAARLALGGRDPRGLGWIKAHGTGTLHGDAAEYHGLAGLLGPDLSSVPVTSLKSSLGHCLGASGAVETVASILAMEAGMVPGTLGTTRADPTMPGLSLATAPLRGRSGAALLLFESFGGRCTALHVEVPPAG